MHVKTMTPRTSTVETKMIKMTYGGELSVTPNVGSYIQLDSGRDEYLQPGDDFQCPGYAGCDFRFKAPHGGPIESQAVNVVVTGRKVKRMAGGQWVRVKVEFVGDSEPSTYAYGYMLLDSTNN